MECRCFTSYQVGMSGTDEDSVVLNTGVQLQRIKSLSLTNLYTDASDVAVRRGYNYTACLISVVGRAGACEWGDGTLPRVYARRGPLQNPSATFRDTQPMLHVQINNENMQGQWLNTYVVAGRLCGQHVPLEFDGH